MTPNVQKAVTLYPERAAEHKWFDVGQVTVDRILGFSDEEILDLIKNPLPFPKLGVAGTDPDNLTFSVLITTAPEDSEYAHALLVETAVLNPLTKHHAKHKGFFLRADLITGKELKISFVDPDDYGDDSKTGVSKIATIVLCLLLKTIHKNSDQYKMYTATPNSSNVKRIRQGKQPLFSWHTVVIEPTKQKFPHQGGAHASPRLHDVRGHWVNRNGKRFWKKPHKRGDASKGVVFHDYKIKPTAPEAA